MVTASPQETISPKNEAVVESPPIDLGQELNKFETQIAFAVRDKSEWVETHPEIVSYFNRVGLGAQKYFLYKGIKVTEYGKADALQEELDLPIYQRLHGGGEGLIEGTHTIQVPRKPIIAAR